MARYVADGVPRELASRVVTFDTLHATLDIAEVAGTARQPVELVAAIYFDVANRLGMPWLREKIAALPGDQHWRMLAKGAMLDDLAGLQRAISGAVLAGGAGSGSASALVAAWQQAHRRAFERAAQLLAELRAVPSPDCGDAVGDPARAARAGVSGRPPGRSVKSSRRRGASGSGGVSCGR